MGWRSSKYRFGNQSKSLNRTPASLKLRSAALSSLEPLEPRCLLSTTTFTALADATVESVAADSTYAGDNFGGDTALVVANTNSVTANAYIKFDISSLTTVNQATLLVNGGEVDPTVASNPVSLFWTSDSTWVEGTGTLLDAASG